MPMDKDYSQSLNKGLFNTFQGKYIQEAFDYIKERVKELDKLPDSEAGLVKFAEKTVNDAFNDRFRQRLVKQVVKSIREAPPNKFKDGRPIIEEFYSFDRLSSLDYELTKNRNLVATLTQHLRTAKSKVTELQSAITAYNKKYKSTKVII